jgi:PAS domain S-box-containing protein
MNKAKQSNIKQKMMLGFCALIIIFILFSALTLYNIHRVSNLSRTIYNHPLVVSNATLQANVYITKIHRSMKDVVLFDSSSRIQQSIEVVNEEEKQVYHHLDIVKKNILGEQGKALENEARKLFDLWRPIRNKVIRLVRNDQRKNAANITIGEGANHVALLEEKMLGLTNYAMNKASEFISETERVHLRLNVTSILFLLLGIFISILVAFLTLKQALLSEKELQKSEEEYRSLIESQTDLVCRFMPDGKFIFVNDMYCQLFNKSKNELVGSRWQPLIVDDDLEIIKEKLSAMSSTNPTIIIENRVISGKGKIHWLQFINQGFFDLQGNLLEIQSVGRDITERKEIELTLKETTETLKQAQRVAKIGSWWYDPITRMPSWTEEMFHIFGLKPRPEALSYDEHKKVIHPEDWDRFDGAVNKAVTKGIGYDLELRIQRPGGAIRYINSKCIAKKDAKGIVTRLIGTTQDITDRKQAEKEKVQLEEQYRQAQKMESVGRLAGGVAHDYNNALSVIMGYTELVMIEVDPTTKLHDDLNQVLKAAKRASTITRQLLAFARKQTIDPRVLDLNKNIENMLKMLRRLIGEDIDLAWLPGTNLWPVKMDPSQIDQILANLCVNARDAIAGVGKVTIETKNVIFDAAYCADHVGFVPGKFAMMALSDNGCGMEKEVLDYIFEPFFTTKDVDKGTGLGLATVYGIVKQNNGFMNVYSEPGKGTTIKIYLRQDEGTSVETQEKKMVEIPRGNGETILLVEDEPSILKLVKKILDSLGYKVLVAETPKEAIRMAKEHAGEIHLLVTDVIMPEMNGLELANYLQSLYPDLRRMFMSGYTANAIAHHGVLDQGVHFIQKPFSKRDLAIIVRKTLDELKI